MSTSMIDQPLSFASQLFSVAPGLTALRCSRCATGVFKQHYPDLYEYADLKIIDGLVVESWTGCATNEALGHDEHDI